MLLRKELLAAGMICIAAIASGENGGPAPADGEVQRWVAQLNDDDYAVREEAARRLTEAGAAAVDGLVEGLTSDQAEVAWRCGAALEQIGLDADDATVDRIVQQIDAVCARRGREGLKSLAKDLHARQKQFRRDRAIAVLQKNGAQIADMGIDGDVAGGFGGGFMPAIGPIIVIDEPIMEMEAMAFPVPVEAVEPELPPVAVFDLFAEIGRVIGRAVVPEGPPPADAPSADVPKEADTDLGKAVEEAAAEAARDAEAAAKEATERAAEAAEEAAGAAKEAAIAADIALPAVAVAEVAIAVDGVETGAAGSWAQLRLDANWSGGDEALSVLKDLPEVTFIELTQTKLTDKALEHLAKLPRLQQLSLHRASFSRDALLEFHRTRPSVVVYAQGEAMMGIHGDVGSSPLVLSTVQEGSGAAQAGLQPGDIIHQIDGVKIRDFSDLTICVSARKSGDKIKVEFERGGEKKTVAVTLSPRTM